MPRAARQDLVPVERGGHQVPAEGSRVFREKTDGDACQLVKIPVGGKMLKGRMTMPKSTVRSLTEDDYCGGPSEPKSGPNPPNTGTPMICRRCGQGVDSVRACVQGSISLPGGGSLPRVLSDGRGCPCGVDGGACHHDGCPGEVCPWCGDQLTNCRAECAPEAA